MFSRCSFVCNLFSIRLMWCYLWDGHMHTHTHTHKLVVSGSLGNFGSKFIDKRARSSFDLIVLFWILVYIHNTDILAG